MEVKVGQIWLWKPTKDLFLLTSSDKPNFNGINLRTKVKIRNLHTSIGNNMWKYINTNEAIIKVLYGS
jgi:hypothetical protein